VFAKVPGEGGFISHGFAGDAAKTPGCICWKTWMHLLEDKLIPVAPARDTPGNVS